MAICDAWLKVIDDENVWIVTGAKWSLQIKKIIEIMTENWRANV